MSGENLKSIIYISKRCPHSRRLLLLLQTKPELKGSIQIVSIDDEPFPKVITSVPSMISNGEIWTADELFAVLEGKPGQEKNMGNQQNQGQHQQQGQPQQYGQPQQQGQPQQYGQHQQQGQPQQQGQSPEGGGDEMLDGYFNSSGLGGGSLGYASIDDTPLNTSDSYYASIDENEGSPIDVKNDGYIKKSKKTEQFDSDYERMMSERGDVGQGSMKMGGM
jgi:hypothetical protein